MGESRLGWENRIHFFATAARLMRHILVEHARGRHAQKRGGDGYRVSLAEAAARAQAAPDLDLLALDEALQALTALDPQQSQIVELRYFGGLSHRRDGRSPQHRTRHRQAPVELGPNMAASTDGKAVTSDK